MSMWRKNRVCFMEEDGRYGATVSCVLGELHVPFDRFSAQGGCAQSKDQYAYDLIVADVTLSGKRGLSDLQAGGAMSSPVPILVLVNEGDVATAVEAMRAGIEDVVEMPADRSILVSSVKKILQQRYDLQERSGKALTRAENRILRLVIDGQTSKEIAQRLDRSVRTIEEHRRRVMIKFGVHNVVELVRAATRA
jgi:FixJ family two-component response regulator